MNTTNSNAVTIAKSDYFALPPHMRMQDSSGPMVLSVISGPKRIETFVPANIIEPTIW
jgi:hypothetical protein